MLQDATGKKLEIGDRVVYSDSEGDLRTGTVERFTSKFIVIAFPRGGRIRKASTKVAKVD